MKWTIPQPFNLVDLMDRHAGSDRVAIRWCNETGLEREVTYAELKTLSERVAKGLIAAGLQRGDRILLLLPRVPEAYIAYMGALKAGLVVLPGSEMLQSADITYRLQHAEAVAVIMDGSMVPRVDQAVHEAPAVRWGWVVNGEKNDRWNDFYRLGDGAEGVNLPKISADDVAFLSYTSGTTGGPKGVIHLHRWSLAHHRVASQQWLDIREGDCVWATAGPGWAKWIWSPFLSTLASGATALVYQGRFDPEKALALMEEKQVQVLCCTPTEYRMMAKVEGLERFDLSHLRSAVSAGEPLNREVIDTFRRHFQVEVRDGYGQTENTLLVGTLKDMKVKPGSMGKPTPGNQVEIIDEKGNPVSVGEVGNIAVHKDAPALFAGYYRDEERTRHAFRGQWYLTGDQARRDEGGYFWFEGRSDDIIISSGYTIGPFEVEDALVKHPAVRECAVVASPDPVRGSVVKAFVVIKTGYETNESLRRDLQSHVKKITAPYKYPRELEFISELPKTTSGKIRRVELRQLEKERKRRFP
ncbi:acyl-CoA synthetase [Desmospora profundinema]|uniref:Acetyl-CoA synthetase n=1 Tax=Desmospora profundinema TaxID=1571184 RepID=A0ABU1IKE9_9BACL|nr:acyl--CoA ligase [Desmospora profundinema]MDR6225255.1 acetyl-CoA synthetase [Desmospora profundinema]